ncbi:MAG: mechanosensitive ion channel family protein [Oscillospiraceae bacterium]|nr:mechanosensitive ion channel family protein [Oscillospiraceae bacterium]
MPFLENFLSSPDFLWVALRVVATIVSTTLAAKVFRITWRAISRETIHHKAIKHIISGLIWLAGIILALSWIPEFGDTAATLIAGSGLVILAFGLAAQETLGNAFSGLFISMFKPFEVGDRINLVGMDIVGFVEDITLRHTIIRTLKNSRLIVPNSVINKELIENASFCNPRAANFIDVTITYDSDVAAACEIMREIIGNHPEFSDNRTEEQKLTAPKVPVFVRNLGLYGVELRASMWTETIANNMAACSDVRRLILVAFDEAGVKISSAKVLEVINKNSD